MTARPASEVIIVTGATSGTGRVAARHLADDGAAFITGAGQPIDGGSTAQ